MRLTACPAAFSGVEGGGGVGRDGGDKIKRDVMISDYKNDGLRLIDIKSFNKTLKST